MDPRYACSTHCLVSFSVDKAVASVVNPAKSTLGDTHDDIDSDSSAEGSGRELRWEHSRSSNGSLLLL